MTEPRRAGPLQALRRTAAILYSGATARGRGRLLLQALGTLVALGLLAWVVVITLRNRDMLTRLIEAPPAYLAALVALTLLSLTLNAAAFWITLRPIVRIRFLDMLATNTVASALALLPGKLSVVWRAIAHNRRDGVPILTVGSYLAANAVVVLAVVVPLGLVGLWRRGADLPYALASLAGVALCAGAAHAAARCFAHEAGLARLRAFAGVLRLRLLDRLLASAWFGRLHRALAILAHAPTLAAATGVRTLDLLIQSARFCVVAAALGLSVSFEKAVLAGTTFFLIGVASPTGALGSREGGTTSLAAITDISGLSTDDFAVIILAVGLTETVIWTAGAFLAILYLRPDRWTVPPAPPTPPA